MSYFGIPIRNGLPIGLGSVAGFGIAPFEPYSLFENGEQGAWYDPSDLSTLFTDSAGTTPVTGVEQFVGLMLDKSKGGVGSNGAARYNLLTYTEQFDNAAWTRNNVTAANTTATTDPIGGTAADALIETGGTGAQSAYITITLPALSHTMSVYCKANQRTWAYVRLTTTVFSAGQGAFFNLANGTVGTVESGVTASIADAGNGWWRCFVTITTTAGSWSPCVNVAAGDNNWAYTGLNGNGIYIWGADLRLTSQANLAPTYQPITASWPATIPGNHATQTTSAKRPKLAARYNLLTYAEQFDNPFWAKVNTTVTANAAVAPNGTTTAELAYPTTSGTDRIVWNGSNVVTIANGLQYVTSIYAKASGKSIVWFGTLAGNTANANCAFFDLQNQTSSAGAYFSSASIVPVGNGWYLCKATATSASTVGYGIYGSADAAGSTSVTANGTDGVLLWGADLRPASQATGLIGPTYQRVVDAATYDTAGFLPYLQFDGLSWSMSTGSIDFTATDKMTVWAGVRKLSEIAGVIAETSSSSQTNNGAFLVSNAFNGSTNYDVQCRGTDRNMRRYVTYAAPITNVLQSSMTTAAADSAAAIQTRINATLNAGFASASAASSGNFGNYPLHLGGRNSAGDFFNGWLTSLIVRGAQSTQSQIEATESWVNGKTGAYV
jgi:hypothetical protein